MRIGGFPKTDEKGQRQYIVFADDGHLYVRGLVPGDRITVYSAAGHLICSAVAGGTEWSTPLAWQAGYVVRVNEKAYKVIYR